MVVSQTEKARPKRQQMALVRLIPELPEFRPEQTRPG